MRRMAIGIVVVFVMLMMVSTVSAVPYTNKCNLSTVSTAQYVNGKENLSSKVTFVLILEARAKLNEFRNSENFTQMEQIANEYFPHEYDQYVDDYISSLNLPSDLLGDEEYYIILLIIVEITLLLLGHNLVGETAALAMASLCAVGPALLWGTALAGLLELLMTDFFIEWLSSFNWEFGVEHYGLIGCFIIYTSVLSIGALLLICAVPVVWIGGILLVYADAITVMCAYIFGNQQQTEITQQEQQSMIQQSMTTETFNDFCGQILQQNYVGVQVE